MKKKPKYCSICGCRKEEHSAWDNSCRAGWPIVGPPNAGSCLCPGYKE